MTKYKKIEHPLLKTETMENLIIQEETLLLKRGTMATIKELVEIYSNLIKYYDQKRDPLNFYFKEKIQILLSNKIILKILDKEYSNEKKNDIKKIKMDLITKKELRYKSIDFNSKISSTNSEIFEKEQKEGIKKLMLKHNESISSINNHIRKEEKIQESKFEEKMKKRRERSKSRSMSKRSIDKLGFSKVDSSSRNLIGRLDLMEKMNEDNPFENTN